MMEWILTALGAEAGEADRITDWSLRWQAGQWGMAAAVILTVLAVLAWWIYRKSPQDVKAGRRYLLTTLRIAFLALLVAILLQPVLRLTLEREVPRILPVLIDATGSMGLADSAATRFGKVSAVLANGKGSSALATLADDLDVSRLVFDDEELDKVQPGPLDSQVVPQGNATALGDMLIETAERYRGAPLAGIVLITDGGQNDGRAIVEASAYLQQSGLPVFAIGVGDPAARDVAVDDVDVREVVLADDAAPVTVRLRAQGMAGSGGRLVVSLGGVEIAEEAVRFEEDGIKEVRTLFVPKRSGEYPLQVRFEADGQEALSENNSAEASVRVIDRRLRVLLVDQAPRWEYKYVEAMLLRERRVALATYLFEADHAVARAPGTPYLEQFPLRPDDLFEYDLVILGDIAPRFLTEVHQGLLREYVATAGGALVVLAGKRFMPGDYTGSEIERMLPVELAGSSLRATDAMATRPVRLALTKAGRESVMLRLADDADASEAVWAGLPPVFWTADVRRAKPAAEVLVERNDADEGETAPVMALHRYGSGEVLFVGTDNLWRWRRNVGDRYHATLWGQIVQRLAGNRLLDETPRLTLRSERRRYRQGERVRVYARLFDRNWEPRADDVIEGVLVAKDDSEARREVLMRAIPGRPGVYRAEFSAGDPGQYRLALAGDEIATLDFAVRDENRELARAGMNERLLRELASQTGGAFLALDEIDQLPAAVTNRTARRTSVQEANLWSSPLFFVLLVLFITLEWILRKLSELK